MLTINQISNQYFIGDCKDILTEITDDTFDLMTIISADIRK